MHTFGDKEIAALDAVIPSAHCCAFAFVDVVVERSVHLIKVY